MSKDLLVLADEYAAATATFARALALKDGADSMSPIARDAGDKRAVLAEALAALDTAQPVHVNVGYGELEAIMGAEFESHGFGAPESNKREYGRFRVGFASGWHSALTAAKQAQPERAPLSDDEIQTIYLRTYNEGFHGRNLEIAFARAIEAAIKQGGQHD